jgi:8-oxo-dGTP pyrophosphatase MutT (NUDIX family)
MDDTMSTEISCGTGVTSAQQACAVPYRRRRTQIEFCVITSSRGRWLFPKGYVTRGATACETALKEAYEEAGLHGRIVGGPLGCFVLPKNGDQLSTAAFLMEVANSDRRWPEGVARERRWVTPTEARELLEDSQLVDMLDTALARLNGDAVAPLDCFGRPASR